MATFRPPRSYRRPGRHSIPADDFFRFPPDDKEEGEAAPSKREAMTASKRRKLRKEMDEAMLRYFGDDMAGSNG